MGRNGAVGKSLHKNTRKKTRSIQKKRIFDHSRRNHNVRNTNVTPVHPSKKRQVVSETAHHKRMRQSIDLIDNFHAMRYASSSNGNASSRAFAEVYEWVGDAVLGELVGRCLLSQFHHAPVSARVFRNLRLAVVTNRNLAQVFEKMGYSRRQFLPSLSRGDARKKLKEKADIVEAIVGEVALRLIWQNNDKCVCAQYRQHLDVLLATILHVHFADRARARQLGTVGSGPLSVAFNPFACLPEEQLDEDTGEVIVNEGSYFEDEFQNMAGDLDREQELQCKSFVDLIDEYMDDGSGPQTRQHHSFPDRDVFIVDHDERTRNLTTASTTALRHIHAAMRELDENHLLRISSEFFEVFKVYGMAVLAERVSLALVQPHITSLDQATVAITPAALTRQRQRVLSVHNLAQCAVMLGVARKYNMTKPSTSSHEDQVQYVLEERLRANTFRAFVGFHSAVATTSTAAKQRSNVLVDEICSLLLHANVAHPDADVLATNKQLRIPEREPMASFIHSMNETSAFMSSKTCDDLHAAGERPLPAKARQTLLIRDCDSENVEDLFEILAKEQEKEKKRVARERIMPNTLRIKCKRSPSHSTDDNHSQNKPPSPNLSRFLHRRFLFCLEEIVILFAQRKTEECRAKIFSFETDLEPCAGAFFRKWEVSTSTLTLAMRDSFYRLLLHDLCQFHALVSTSKNTRDGTRITQLRLPLHYTWAKVTKRLTREENATS